MSHADSAHALGKPPGEVESLASPVASMEPPGSSVHLFALNSLWLDTASGREGKLKAYSPVLGRVYLRDEQGYEWDAKPALVVPLEDAA